MNEAEKKLVESAEAAMEVARAPANPQGITYHKIPSGVLLAARRVLGQLPHDQVKDLLQAIDTQCSPLEG